MFAIYVRNGLEQGRIFPLDEKKANLIGRSPEAAVMLADDSISRRHAEISFTGGGWTLKDLGSTNGTYLNALPVREKRLALRDIIMLGPVELLVIDQHAEAVGAVLQPDRTVSLHTTESLPVRLVHGIRGSSPALLAVIGAIESLAEVDSTVLIGGETGTGKELAARAIHASSRRRQGPFVALNCAAIPENLVESELFGHEPGAFTGATIRRRGHFEEAAGGTLFLDEVGDLPLRDQAKLLRAIETKAVRRLGGEEEVRVDLRILAASHRDLGDAVRRGTFREDLYHRLKVAEILMPALRSRPSDIPEMAAYFLTGISMEIGRAEIGITKQATQLLQSYPWPGNVRELKNVLERAAILSKGGAVTPLELSFLFSSPGSDAPPGEGGRFPTLREFVVEQERAHVQKAMKLAAGNKTRAAELLGISRQTLYEKLQSFLYGSDCP
jgi:DNA-binding NtrC family response regulator